MSQSYIPQDAMSLWWMGNPSDPKLVGKIFLVEGNRKVALEYGDEWLKGGFALSEDLPLQSGAFTPEEKATAAGAVDDARPDRWGERVIRLLENPPRASLLEFLYFAGDNRFGALGVSLDSVKYLPRSQDALPQFESISEIEQTVRRILAGESVSEKQRRLIQPGVTFGGARPKSLVQIDGRQWVVKFSEEEVLDTPLVEHVTMSFARKCGILTADSMPVPVAKGHAVAVLRFDRLQERRLHVISAFVALRAAGEAFGYPELSQLLRRISNPETLSAQQEELFRRMVFNILMDNTDDHEKNHALVRGSDGAYLLSAAFDVVPSNQGLRYQQMRVGKNGSESTLENALSESKAFGLPENRAREIVGVISKVVDGWQEYFANNGVMQRDIDSLAQYIDGDFLRSQRKQFIKSLPTTKASGRGRSGGR